MSLLFDNVEQYEFRSRAVNIEEEEEDKDEEIRTEFKTTFEEGKKQKCQQLYILVGKCFSDYVKLGVLKEFECQAIGQLIDTTSNKTVNKFYQLFKPDQESKPGPLVYFTAVDGITEKNYFNWTAELFTSITEPSTEIVVLSTESRSSYIGPASLSSYTSAAMPSEDPHFFIRCLQTSVNGVDERYTQLDCPNILSGLSAQVFLHCEVYAMKSSHFLVYSSLSTPPSLIHQLLASLEFSTQKMSVDTLNRLETRMLQARSTSCMYT